MTKWAACQVAGHIRPPQKSIFIHHLLYSTYKRISHSHILDLSQRKCTWIDFATAKMTIFIYFSKFIKIFLPLVLDLTTTMKRHHSRFIFLNYLWSIERQQKDDYMLKSVYLQNKNIWNIHILGTRNLIVNRVLAKKYFCNQCHI